VGRDPAAHVNHPNRLGARAQEGAKRLMLANQHGDRHASRRMDLTLQVAAVLAPELRHGARFSQNRIDRFKALAAINLGMTQPLIATALLEKNDPAFATRLSGAFSHKRKMVDRTGSLASELPILDSGYGEIHKDRSKRQPPNIAGSPPPEYLAARRQAIIRFDVTADRGELLRHAERILQSATCGFSAIKGSKLVHICSSISASQYYGNSENWFEDKLLPNSSTACNRLNICDLWNFFLMRVTLRDKRAGVIYLWFRIGDRLKLCGWVTPDAIQLLGVKSSKSFRRTKTKQRGRELDLPISRRTPKLVIFDCDGVLVDSEPIFNRVLHAYLLSSGARLSLDKCHSLFVGKCRHDVERYVSDRGLRLTEKWPQDFYVSVLDALRTEVAPIPGAREAVAMISSAGIPLCVASNGLLAKMHVTLERSGLLPWFEGKMYSAYDVGASKPAPDVFLHAAEMNRVAPEHCVVVEDSASGFEAASNAAMTCFAYDPNATLKPENLFGARRLTDMADLPKLLGL